MRLALSVRQCFRGYRNSRDQWPLLFMLRTNQAVTNESRNQGIEIGFFVFRAYANVQTISLAVVHCL